MLGWRLISERELALREQLVETRIALLAANLREAKEYAAKCEALLDHERSRIDAERERADRIADSLFQSQGLPATSTTVVQEQRAVEENAADKRAKFMNELAEIYGESMDELLEDGAEPLPETVAS